MDVIELVKKEMLRRGYSLRTIKTYIECLKEFLKCCYKEPRKITKSDVRKYLDSLHNEGKSGSTLNIHLSALIFLMKNILNKNFTAKIKYSRTPKSLPVVLLKEEVASLINSIENKKHRLMIKLLYSAGLRVSELVNLRVKDFEFENNFGWVRRGKGNKDRMFIVAGSLKQELNYHIENNNLGYDSFLFPSYNGHLSTRSVQEIVKKAAKKAGIRKSVHPHTLRHSYATHLIENGYDVASVQLLLGHNSPNTTMVYVHIAKPNMLNIKSPLDNLQLQKDNEKQNYEHKQTKEPAPNTPK